VSHPSPFALTLPAFTLEPAPLPQEEPVCEEENRDRERPPEEAGVRDAEATPTA
jgi:hypothetical protein